MNESQERELVMKAQEGDEMAFKELVDSNVRRIYGLAFKYTGNHQDADDVAQEAFIKAYKALPGFEGTARFSTWLYRITVNCCISLKRKQKHWAGSLDEETARQVEDEKAIDQERRTMAMQTRDKVSEAMQALSPQQRAVFIMKYLKGKKIREIAEVLECAEGTVKQQLYRAVRKMREHLAPLVETAEVAS